MCPFGAVRLFVKESVHCLQEYLGGWSDKRVNNLLDYILSAPSILTHLIKNIMYVPIYNSLM